MKGVSFLWLVGLVAVLISGCAPDPGPATDESGEEHATAATQTLGTADQRHCVIDVGTRATACYASFTEALSTATGGRITDAPADARAALSDGTLVARINDRDAMPKAEGRADRDLTLWAIFFMGPQYSEWSFTLSATSGPCTTPLSDVDGYITTYEMQHWLVGGQYTSIDNEISSFQCFNNCWCRLYDGDGVGDYIGYSPKEEVLGPMENRASSIYFS
jgi:hypothetical protein